MYCGKIRLQELLVLRQGEMEVFKFLNAQPNAFGLDLKQVAALRSVIRCHPYRPRHRLLSGLRA